jgi:hypothetical protein
MGLIYEIHCCLRWHDIHTKFHEDWFRYSGNIKGKSIIREFVVLVLQMRGIPYVSLQMVLNRIIDPYIRGLMTIVSGTLVI